MTSPDAGILLTDDKTFGMSVIGRLALVVYPPSWRPEQFEAAVELMKSMRDTAPTSVLIFATGQTLSAGERAMLKERLPTPENAPPMRQALLTDSTVMRGTLTALSWLINKPDYRMKAFPTREWKAALDWLTVTATFDPALARARLVSLLSATGAGRVTE